MNSTTYLYAKKFAPRQRREIFINDILKVNTNFIKFDKKNIFNYVLSLNRFFHQGHYGELRFCNLKITKLVHIITKF